MNAETNPALRAILTNVKDSAERERITGAFHTLSEGDLRSYPVVYALVANGCAMSIVESASEIKAAVKEAMESLKPQGPQIASKGRSWNWLNWVCAVIGVGGMMSIWSAYSYKTQSEARVALMATQIRENGQLLEDLKTAGGSMRYYEAEDAHGKKIRILSVSGGSVSPTEAFITAGGGATVVFPAMPKPQNK